MKVLTKEGVRGQIIADLNCLQTCLKEETFCRASQLFVNKWRAKNKDTRVQQFLDYFEAQWLSKNLAWYEGAAFGYPSTNNGLEATNATIKREHTIRERMPVSQFRVRAEELVQSWSEVRDPSSVNGKEFAWQRTVHLHEWTARYHCAAKNLKVLQRKQKHCTMYFTASSKSAPITSERLTHYQATENKWTTFAEFQKEYYGLWVIVIFPKRLEDSTCTCPYFSKKTICKHVLGMQIRMKLITVPEEAKQIPLGQKRKRGRPSKSKRALLFQ